MVPTQGRVQLRRNRATEKIGGREKKQEGGMSGLGVLTQIVQDARETVRVSLFTIGVNQFWVITVS